MPIKDTVFKQNRNSILRYADKEIGIKVGVFGEEASRKAYLQHHPEKPSTPRAPFIEDEAIANEDKVMEILSQIDLKDAKTTLNSLGASLSESMKKRIMNHDYAPNAMATIRKKGFDHRLVETGDMFQAVSFKPLKKGD